MAGFVQGVDREQVTLFPARLGEYVAEGNPVRAVTRLSMGLTSMGLASPTFNRLISAGPAIIRGLLKLYIYGNLNRGRRAGALSESASPTSK
jgi:hypothetical protein